MVKGEEANEDVPEMNWWSNNPRKKASNLWYV